MKRLLFLWLASILGYLANIEFSLGWNASHRKQHLRGLHLRAMSVKHMKNVSVGCDFHLRIRGNLELGERCAIGSFTHIWNYAPVLIGDDFLSAGSLTINTGGHDVSTLMPFSQPVRIGNRVWCGVNVTILAGVTIGDDVVIAAGSVVNNSIQSGVIVAGVPARVIKPIERDLENFWRAKWPKSHKQKNEFIGIKNTAHRKLK